MDISYDLRSAALTIAQAFLKKWPDIVIKILRYGPRLWEKVRSLMVPKPTDIQCPDNDVRLESG